LVDTRVDRGRIGHHAAFWRRGVELEGTARVRVKVGTWDVSDSPYHLLWMLLEPTVRCRFRGHSSALCVPTFETKKELDG